MENKEGFPTVATIKRKETFSQAANRVFANPVHFVTTLGLVLGGLLMPLSGVVEDDADQGTQGEAVSGYVAGKYALDLYQLSEKMKKSDSVSEHAQFKEQAADFRQNILRDSRLSEETAHALLDLTDKINPELKKSFGRGKYSIHECRTEKDVEECMITSVKDREAILTLSGLVLGLSYFFTVPAFSRRHREFEVADMTPIVVEPVVAEPPKKILYPKKLEH